LNKKEFVDIVGLIIFDASFEPMSTDSYNEEAIAKAIRDTGKVAELAMAAVNMACIGYGQKKYGSFKFKNVIIDIIALLRSCGVQVGLSKDAKLAENELTPQRLCRAFREQIREYVIAHKFETYINRKYSSHDPRFFDVMFRGAEYLDNLTNDQCEYLLATYQAMDVKLHTNITERVRRVFQAKGYIKKAVVV